MKKPRRIYSLTFLVMFLMTMVTIPLGSNAGGKPPVPQTIGNNIKVCPNPTSVALTRDEVIKVVQQAVTYATRMNTRATIAVTDREGNVLAVYRMKGANRFTAFPSGPLKNEAIRAEFAAVSKAGTCSFFGTTGNAFTPRTAGFIIQENIPPGVRFSPGGPLFGVQFSSLVFISNVNGNLPLGLSADPGGLPLYKNGFPCGGIGVEIGDGYSFDPNPIDADQSIEELIAAAGSQGFEPPKLIRADNIYVDGIRLPYSNAPDAAPVTNLVPLRDSQFLKTELQAFPDKIIGGIPFLGAGSRFKCGELRGMPVRILIGNNFVGPISDVNERFPIKGNKDLTRDEVETILSQGIAAAYRARGAIRQPLGSFAEVNITVCGADGEILGLRATPDAPIFGVDVSAQKARSAAFMSRADCGTILRRIGLGNYVDAAAKDGVMLDGTVAFSARGFGFLHRPFLPDGINDSPPGPFSPGISSWSPFNVGLQLDLLVPTLRDILNNRFPPPNRDLLPANIRNGFQIFAGAVPLYKGTKLVGAIGISGDGIDQDDFVGTNGSAGFEAPENMRCDQMRVRGNVRLPWVKFPRHPELP
ncbi:MAG: heme-binding protein [Blastocatellia bacterium]|nr:heme-binding protein [Blastocatellia bacterium]